MITSNLQEFYNFSLLGSIICIDYGTKKSGIALSDNNRLLSIPFCTITSNGVIDCVSQINKIIIKKNPKSIVLGLPLYLNGTESKQTEITKKFAIYLKEHTKLPIFLQDERLSSRGAENYLKDFNFNRKEREKMSDMTSASFILEIVLQRIKNICMF
jgi:putative Holliday junction resolvase